MFFFTYESYKLIRLITKYKTNSSALSLIDLSASYFKTLLILPSNYNKCFFVGENFGSGLIEIKVTPKVLFSMLAPTDTLLAQLFFLLHTIFLAFLSTIGVLNAQFIAPFNYGSETEE